MHNCHRQPAGRGRPTKRSSDYDTLSERDFILGSETSGGVCEQERVVRDPRREESETRTGDTGPETQDPRHRTGDTGPDTQDRRHRS
ncbi:hypothetical protein EYF80_006899 [Liparis tanakae]|uniref:Uncharacterized protein n=1 Tax=Liparis tanakae TaxID=230148 RepID=A0A4Z2J066_9TELE|nr:hypothetical protein EYF80_006899 [Liparis tanakae]